MGLFSAAFKAATATKAGAESIFTVVDIAFPAGAGGTLRLTADAPGYGSRLAQGRLPAVEQVASRISPRVSDFGKQVVRITLADTDQAVAKILTGRYDCRRSSVKVMWGHPSVAESDWYTDFTGILDDWSFNGKQTQLSATTDDRVLQGYIPRRQILKGWAPNAPATELGKYVPIVLGIHDSQGLALGMLPAIPYSISATTGYRYVVSLGQCKSVPRVYKNGTLQTVTTHYTITYPSLGGLVLTSIDFVGATVATDRIQCDVEGLTDTGLSSGNVMTAPTDLLKWMLNNLVYGDWNGGTYLTGAPIDAELFARTASYQAAFRGESSKYLGGTTEQTTGQALFNEWLRSHLMIRGRWSNLGKIGVFPLDHRWAPYSADLQVNEEDTLETLSLENSAEAIASKLSLEYLYGQADGKFWQALELQDLARWQIERVTESFAFAWSASRFQ